MAENSEVVTLSGSGASSVTWASWYPEIVIANDGSGSVFVRTDGTTATGGNGDVSVPSGVIQTLANEQPEPEADAITGYPPYLTPGWTAQEQNYVYAGGTGTFVSLYSTSTPTVTVTAQ